MQTRIIVVTKSLEALLLLLQQYIFGYIISWILGFFGIKSFLWGTSWIAIVFNVIAAI
ncbi:MAG: hypothetical protein R2816_03830 [Flavobacteriaceae bacterium]